MRCDYSAYRVVLIVRSVDPFRDGITARSRSRSRSAAIGVTDAADGTNLMNDEGESGGKV